MKGNPLRSVGTRLSLALLLVVAGSLTLVYLVVIPSLQSRLIDGKITQLRKSLPLMLARPNPPKNLGGTYYQDLENTLFAEIRPRW